MKAYGNNNKILTRCRYIKAEDIRGTIVAARFFLTGTDIAFMVTNSTIFTDSALIYGDLHTKGFLYTKYGEMRVLFAHPGWVGFNT